MRQCQFCGVQATDDETDCALCGEPFVRYQFKLRHALVTALVVEAIVVAGVLLRVAGIL